VFVSSVKQFFKFCEAQNWLPASPAKHLKRPEVEQGSRTVPFTDAEYAAILAQVQKDGDAKGGNIPRTSPVVGNGAC